MNRMKYFMSLLVVVALMTAGCRSTSTTTHSGILEYSCIVPPGLNKEVVLHRKHAQPEKHDAHRIYRECHKRGWLMQIKHYIKAGRPDFDYFSGIVPQETGMVQTPKLIGISEARTIVLKQELIIGSDSLKKQLIRILSEQGHVIEPTPLAAPQVN